MCRKSWAAGEPKLKNGDQAEAAERLQQLYDGVAVAMGQEAVA